MVVDNNLHIRYTVVYRTFTILVMRILFCVAVVPFLGECVCRVCSQHK